MNAEQIAKLKELARKAQIDGWPFYGVAYQKAASPDVVLELIAKLQTPLHEHNARFAIDGAMWKGHEGVDPPPTEDHWLMPYWKMARELAEFKAAAERTTSPVSALTDDLAGKFWPIIAAATTIPEHEASTLARKLADLAAAAPAPAHETITQQGGELVCTACGTTAPAIQQPQGLTLEEIGKVASVSMSVMNYGTFMTRIECALAKKGGAA